MRPLLRETLSTIAARAVDSVLVILIVATAVVTVSLTSGKTAGASSRVIETIDSAGTRSIVVEAEGGAGLQADAIERIARLRDVEWIAAFGPAFDVHNTANGDGLRIAARTVYAPDFRPLGVDGDLAGTGAVASPSALTQLGMLTSAGSVTDGDGRPIPIVGTVTASTDLLPEPVLLLPQPTSAWRDEVETILVVVQSPQSVQTVADSIPGLAAVDDIRALRITTSAELAQLRALVEGELGRFSRALLVGVIALAAILVAVLTFGSVIVRRRDYGRRRALGASRADILGLLLTQTAILSVLGALLGWLVALVALIAAGDPPPLPVFALAVSIEIVAASLVSTIPPALVAGFRDPVRELRVP